jgi:hypothetical protein
MGLDMIFQSPPFWSRNKNERKRVVDFLRVSASRAMVADETWRRFPMALASRPPWR